MRRTRRGRTTPEVLCSVAGFEQSSLSLGQPFLRRTLFVFETSNRLLRFQLSLLEAVALFFRLPPLASELLRPLRESSLLIEGVLQLRIVDSDSLLLSMMFDLELGDRAGRL